MAVLLPGLPALTVLSTFEPMGESPTELMHFAALLMSGSGLLTPQPISRLSAVGAGTAARLMERLIGGS
ncbi:hypothetical protein [Streptomyces sp. NPDC056105]|uniref:hypothetical protein n=1 Tax=Streptomyces sp. NPDC056105 TaxID=3345714 RepID=UPI0035DDA074